MYPLYITVPAVILLIVVISFVFYRCLTRAGKSQKSKVSAIQRREHFRIDVLEPASFSVTLSLDVGSLTGCRMVNISVGGAAVLAVRHPIVLDIGATIKEVTITFSGGEEVRSPAVVKYVLTESDSDWNKYGIEFTGISDAQSGIIARYVLQAETKIIKEQRTTPAKKA